MRLPLRSLLPALILLIPIALRAQSTPVELERPDTWSHYIKPLSSIRVSSDEWGELEKTALGREYLEFKIVVSANGTVESAESVGRTTMHLDEARAIELARRFKPWYIDGTLTRVRITDQVKLAPPERWADPHVPFPQVSDLSQMRITLDRTRCFGTCPDYAVTITGNGDVHFTGRHFVQVPGDHTARISPAVVRDLLQKFRETDFFSALDHYRGNETDNPTQTITLAIGPRTKTVVDYVGERDGIPTVIANLEDQIDEAADTAHWVTIDDKTPAALTAEHWQFGSSSPENIGIYVSAIKAGNADLIARFLAAKTPVLAHDNNQLSPICMASTIDGPSLATRMIDQVKDVPANIANECLSAAARSGKLPLVRLWIQHGADPTAPSFKTADGRSTYSPFQCAILSFNPEVVRELLSYKVDLNAPFENEPTLIFLFQRAPFTTDPAIVLQVMDLLINAGVDVNARNRNGETAVYYAAFHKSWLDRLVQGGADINARFALKTALIARASFEDAVRNLLADGADPTITNNAALMNARKAKCDACAALIQAALAQRTPSTEK